MSIFTDTRLILNESSTVFWSDDQVYDAINQAQIDLYTDSEVKLSTSTMTAGAGVSLVAIPSGIMIPKYITGLGRDFFITTQTKLEQHNKDWFATPPGYPKHWIQMGATILRPYPRPDITYEFDIIGAPWPTEVTASQQDITAPEEFKLAVAYRAAAELFEYTRPDMADGLLAQSDEHLMEYKQRYRNHNPHNIRRIRPGNRLSTTYRGTIRMGQGYN